MTSLDQDGPQGIVLPDGYVLLEVGDRFCLLDPDGAHLLVKPSNPDELHRIEHFAWQHALDDIELRVRRDLSRFRAVSTPASEKLRRLREYLRLLEARPASHNTSGLGGRLHSQGVVAIGAAAALVIVLAAGQYITPLLFPAGSTITRSNMEEAVVADYLRESAQPRRSIAVPARGTPRAPSVSRLPHKRLARTFWPASPPRRAPAVAATPVERTDTTVERVEHKNAPVRGVSPRPTARRTVRVKRFTITVGVFAHPKAAQARAQVVRRKGYVARIVPVGTRFRVVAGGYKSQALAEQIAEAFRLYGLPATLTAARPYRIDASTRGD